MKQRVCRVAYQMRARHASYDVFIRSKLDILIRVDGHCDCAMDFYPKGRIVRGPRKLSAGFVPVSPNILHSDFGFGPVATAKATIARSPSILLRKAFVSNGHLRCGTPIFVLIKCVIDTKLAVAKEL